MEMGVGEVSASRELHLDQLLPEVPVDRWCPRSSLLPLLRWGIVWCAALEALHQFAFLQEPWCSRIPSGVKVFGGWCRDGETLKRCKFCYFSYFVSYCCIWAWCLCPSWGLLRGLQTTPISAGWLWEYQLLELLVLLKYLCIFFASFILSSCWQVLWGCGEKKGLCKMPNVSHPSPIPQVLSWVSKPQSCQLLTSNLLCQ